MPPRPPVQHLAKVAPRLRSAISDFGQDNWEPAVGAFYYACFHVALALLSTQAVSPATHRGVREMLSLHFVMNGPLPQDSARLLAQLMTDREIADYGVGRDIGPRAAFESARRALEFLEAALPALAQRAPETSVAMPDLAPLRALVGGYTAST